ncbi:MAG: TRAP transporter substrate-binding protein [Brevinema sp.]
MTKKLFAALVFTSLAFSACGGSNSQVRKLRFAHNHTEENPSHVALLKFGELVKEQTDGNLTIEFFPNGILGDERSVVEQVQAGTIDFTRTSANTLENFNKEFGVYLLPYLFKTSKHFYETMSAPVTETVYNNLTNSGMIALTYQDAGERSFYMKSGPITKPADLKGKKIRVINSKSSIRMVELLGGVPTPIPYGEIYTALQQGVIDGAENNAQALTLDKHGEVAKFYSLDAHVHLTDFVVMSHKTWLSLSPEYQKIIKDSLVVATEYHNQLWAEAIAQSLETAQKEMGVKINEVDKNEFEALVKPMYTEAEQDPVIAPILKEILSLR